MFSILGVCVQTSCLFQRFVTSRGRSREYYGPTGNEFRDEVNWVQIGLEKNDHDHLISPEERFKLAVARQ